MLAFVPTLRALCGIMSVPGCETRAAEFLKREFGPLFDSFSTDAARNQIFFKKSKKPGSHPVLMLDAHFDEVGMIVSEVTENGFLRVMPVGGLDKKLLPAARVRVYPDADAAGEHTPESDAENGVPGVIGYVPPELVLPGEKTPEDWNAFLVDIGTSSRAQTEALGIGVGTPVGYADSPESLTDTRIKGRGLDDKSCAAALLCAAANIPAEDLDYDIALTLSAGEEVGGDGAGCAAWTVRPDLAFIADVGFAATPGVDENDGAPFGGGPVFSLSAVTDRKLTGDLIALAEKNRIPVSTTVDARSTGTNGDAVVYVREGIPAAVAGIPIGGMHSYAETLDTRDADSLIRLLTVFMGGADPGPIPPEEPAEPEKPQEDPKEPDSGKSGEDEKAPLSELPAVPVTPLSPDADFTELTGALAEEFGPSGCEGRVAEKIRAFASLYADEVTEDRLGSVIAVYRRQIGEEAYDAGCEPVSGDAPDCGRLMLLAHMDESGFMVRSPDGEGYLRPVELSVKEPMTLCGEDVWIGDESRLTPGYFGVKAVHLGGLGDFGSLYADIGAENGKAAEKKVKKGDFGAYRGKIFPLGDGSLAGKALSGRPGCAVLLDLLRRLRRENAALPFDVCFVFTARELVGGSSAYTAAHKAGADTALIFDGLAANDADGRSGLKYGAGCALGEGAAIPYMDRGAIFDRELLSFLCRAARENAVPVQPYRFASPRSDAGAVNRSGEGVRCALIGWPVRNRTTASEIVRKSDLLAVRELAYRAVTELAKR